MMNPGTTEKDVQKKDDDQKLKSRGMWGQPPKTNGGWVIQFLIAFFFAIGFIGLVVFLIVLFKESFHCLDALETLKKLSVKDLLSAVATSVLISVAVLGARTAYHAYSVSQDILSETRERGKINETLEAWNTVTKKFSGGGKLRALEFLAKRGESLDGIDLSEKTMEGKVYLGDLDLSEETLDRKISLLYAKFNGAHLTRANLTRANLNGANLTEANLNGAHLNGANLTFVNLDFANLDFAKFNEADLTGAILNEAILTDANLSCAILTDVEGLTQEQLDTAYYLSVPDDMSRNELEYIKKAYKIKGISDEIIDNLPRPYLPKGLTIKSKAERKKEKEES